MATWIDWGTTKVVQSLLAFVGLGYTECCDASGVV